MSKRALVTGGSRGIGRAISIMLAKNGFEVIINYKSNKESAMETKLEVENLGAKCSLLQFDISDFKNAYKIIEEEIATNGKIDVLVFNAGIRRDSLFPVMKEEDWDSVIDVNLKSFYYITKPVIKSMFENKYGKIVVVSSTSGQTGMPGQVNYCASKFGLIGAAKSLAVELARRGINVNIVAPGFIDTEMTKDLQDKFEEIKKTIPIRRIGSVEDVANAVEFLVSDKADYIVGQIIAVNGGLLT
ncbi:MAG TPA: 3-oxoacyl-ACP reductase FabG [Spirochaetota bacterium]|nr:3-oxoacyl-ACP reductase FabG [Spirochaetota bacterium]HOL57299.1 3-oxoacyl-ACP reductase FabG [Spirochaetota bacterium]HPP03225.1 3-oxoacyl-ACP reductase FabG [Spirochaetota bacterium]